MNKPEKKVNKVIFALIFSVLLFVILAFLSKYFLLPMLPEPWQNNLIWLGTATVGTIAILSGLAQLTGYSLKDLFSSPKPTLPPSQTKDSQGEVILNVGAYGRIDRIGDILQSNSTKIVVSSTDVLGSPRSSKTANVENLIKDIQSALYEDNSRLPYVLTLCLDLCSQVNLSEKYDQWLKIELNGYKNYQEFRGKFDNEIQFENWMQTWAPHRLIEPYVKFAYRSETGRPILDKLPLQKILVAFPVAEVARHIQNARDSNNTEFSLLLRQLSTEHFDELKGFVAQLSPQLEVSPDLQVFYTVSNLEQILNGVRSIVLSLLRDARQQVSE